MSCERVRAEIDFDAFDDNLETLTALSCGKKPILVVKADGYGHGALALARHVGGRAAMFAVATVEEGAILRAGGISRPILVLGNVPTRSLGSAVLYSLVLTVGDSAAAEEYAAFARYTHTTLKVHLAVDTGMCRLGFLLSDYNTITDVCAARELDVNGVFTHLTGVADATQAAQFGRLVRRLEADGFGFEFVHMENSAATLAGGVDTEEVCNAVRLGAALYGIDCGCGTCGLRPIMRLVAAVAHVEEFDGGQAVGYGGTAILQGKRRLAQIAAGYADGYPRYLSNRGYVLLYGRRAPVVGRVCMDSFVVDVTDIPQVRYGDEAVLLGRDCGEVITAESLAAQSCDGFNYELVCSISARVPRVYIGSERRDKK